MRSLKGGIGEIVSKLGKRMVVGLALKVSGDRPDEVFAAACKLGWYISTTATISKDYCLALSLSLSFPSFSRWGDGWSGGSGHRTQQRHTQDEVKIRAVQSKRRTTLV